MHSAYLRSHASATKPKPNVNVTVSDTKTLEGKTRVKLSKPKHQTVLVLPQGRHIYCETRSEENLLLKRQSLDMTRDEF